ncbi:MAG: TlpA family protein disulfide reductase [gamma proteobacterium endosymbiont of Lamellibrachia anaximandri]|nr:TlpA family protein disulfide reductase [gamma proteobacterium endosymbiont of Lamellibrachia anaximandri]
MNFIFMATRFWRHFSIAVLLLMAVAGCSEESPRLIKGQPMPGFLLDRLESGSLDFPNALRGKVVAIRFWADWCPFCESEMKNIEPVYRLHQERGLVILAINVRQDRKTAAAFIRKLNISYDVLLDRDGDVARRYGVIALPTTFIVDRQGNLHTRILGESTPELFHKIVEELL